MDFDFVFLVYDAGGMNGGNAVFKITRHVSNNIDSIFRVHYVYSFLIKKFIRLPAMVVPMRPPLNKPF
jgi:hypothetical protein